MKRLLMILPLLLLASGANADMASVSARIPRHDISGMTCDQVQAALQSSGKAILRWPSKNVPGMMRYGKYMSGPQAKCRRFPDGQP
jgi:hypothetical protein